MFKTSLWVMHCSTITMHYCSVVMWMIFRELWYISLKRNGVISICVICVSSDILNNCLIWGLNHGNWKRVSQLGLCTNERSIQYEKICTCLTSLIKTIGGEFPVRLRNSKHNYAYTRLHQILFQDSSRTSALSSVSCTG